MKRNEKVSKLSMLEDFEIQGYWNLFDSDERLSGNLYSDDGNYYLEVLGSFSNRLENNSRYNYIHGVTVKGEKITLISSITINKSDNFPGISTEKLLVNRFIVGGHLTEVEQIKFHSVNVTMSHLSTWFNSRIYDVDSVKENGAGRLEKETATFTPPRINNYYIKSIESSISNNYNFTSKLHSVKTLTYSFTELFKIKPNVYRSYDWYEDVIMSLRRLMTLLINEPIYTQRIVFNGDKEKNEFSKKELRKKYYLYYSQREVEVKKKFFVHKMLFSYQDIKTDIEKVFNRWFEKEQKLKNVYNLYFSSFYNRKEDLETKFLNTIQTLEVYHRSKGDGKTFTDKKKKEYLVTIDEVLKGQVPDNILDVVISKLQYFNEYSLSKRLKEIIDNLNKDTVTYLFESNKKFKSFNYKVVNTRNYLTHYGESNIKKYQDIELYYATVILKVLASIILFKELDIDEEKILIALKNNPNLSTRIVRSKFELQFK